MALVALVKAMTLVVPVALYMAFVPVQLDAPVVPGVRNGGSLFHQWLSLVVVMYKVQ
jgi:hypothetical protein